MEENGGTKEETPDITAPKATQAKNFLAPLTIFSFILSLPVLALVIWLLYMKDYDCEILLRLPRLRIGIGIWMIFVFLISNAVVFCRSRFPMPGLVAVMVPLLVMLIMGLALVGVSRTESRAIPASPMWLKLKIHDNNNWNNIKSCIYDTHICDDLVSRTSSLKSYDFSLKKLSSIESGCCKPPTSCVMEYVNATFWEKEEDEATDKSYPYDRDCESWNNDQSRLCYNCYSCRQGFLTTLQRKWTRLGIFLVVMAILLVIAHLLLFVATMWERYKD
ncbi:hypothetical protein HHK36_025991 [Tetracentron sinense]|uniref:Uncharacterized protein n=1 Tax=Tetracentron sinense TaxID=13715 RepID=A0A835D3J7_TETSI|nr:hypothetical protein HHK36_025991 [Tetracentron sinense]